MTQNSQEESLRTSDGRVPLEAVIVDLSQRGSRPADYETENRALASLMQETTNPSGNVLQMLAETALSLCAAHSAGISILEEDGEQTVFRWHAVAGQWSPFLGGTMPREISPCGTVLDRNSALLLWRPERHYTIPPEVTPAIVEVLLVPFHLAGKPAGTIWVIAHDEHRRFDGEDQRLITSLGRFAAAAHQVSSSVHALRFQIGERKQAEAELRRRTTQFETLLNEAPLGVYLVDADFRIRQANPTALAAFGNIPDLIGRDFDEVVHIHWSEPYADEIVQRFRHTLETGEPYSTPERIETRLDRGVQEFYQWQTNRIQLPDGRHGVVCYFRDISAQVLARAAIAESEERFRTLVSLITDVPWTTDAEGRFTSPQPIWAAYTGQTWEEMRDFGWSQVLHPEDRAEIRESWDRAWAAGGLYESHGRLWHAATQQYRYFEARATPLRNPDGSVREWVGTCTDVHERRRAEESLRQSEQQFHRLADAMPQIVWAARPDGHIDYYNERWYEYTGFSRGEYGQQSWEPILHPDDVQLCVNTYFGCIKAEQPYQIQYRFKDRWSGGYRWFLGRAMPVRDDQGKVIRWFGTCTDIDDTKKAEEALREVDRRKDEFLATLAHELRNPLAPIRNAVELMRQADGNSALLLKARSMMERQLGQMVRLVDDLFDVSRITNGKMQLRKQRVELAAVVQSAVESTRPVVEASGHQLSITLPPEPVLLDADATRLAQVLANLLNNAAKYTERGGHIWLTAECHSRGRQPAGEVVVSVRDNGIGIPAEQLTRVFEMFSQVEPALERSQGGLGIGLALVRGLVELHGGSIEARSNGHGTGSEFVVRLPMADFRKPMEATEDDLTQESKIENRKSLRILIVDDNRDAADSLGMLLGVTGHRTHAAHDGLEAVQAAAAFQPDVVLLDIGLPEITGYEVARRIRAEPWGKNMILIALTGWGQQEDKRRATEAGFDRHMTKPVDPSALATLLAGLPLLPDPI